MAIKTLYISNKKHRWESDIPMIDSKDFEGNGGSDLKPKEKQLTFSFIGIQISW